MIDIDRYLKDLVTAEIRASLSPLGSETEQRNFLKATKLVEQIKETFEFLVKENKEKDELFEFVCRINLNLMYQLKELKEENERLINENISLANGTGF